MRPATFSLRSTAGHEAKIVPVAVTDGRQPPYSGPPMYGYIGECLPAGSRRPGPLPTELYISLLAPNHWQGLTQALTSCGGRERLHGVFRCQLRSSASADLRAR